MQIEGFHKGATKWIQTIDIAIDLCLFCMKAQIFLECNKRGAVIFANHYLISHREGILVIPEKNTIEFKNLLMKSYDGEDILIISSFMKKNCRKIINS